MAPAIVLFQNKHQSSLCLLRPGCRRGIKHFSWLPGSFQMFRMYYDVFQKQGAIKGMCAPVFFFRNMKATIVMCALVFVFPKNEHHNLHVCALRLGFFQKYDDLSSCESRVFWKTKYSGAHHMDERLVPLAGYSTANRGTLCSEQDMRDV